MENLNDVRETESDFDLLSDDDLQSLLESINVVPNYEHVLQEQVGHQIKADQGIIMSLHHIHFVRELRRICFFVGHSGNEFKVFAEIVHSVLPLFLSALLVTLLSMLNINSELGVQRNQLIETDALQNVIDIGFVVERNRPIDIAESVFVFSVVICNQLIQRV